MWGRHDAHARATTKKREISVALRNFTHNNASGKNQINNKILLNLSGEALNSLLEYINTSWEEGQVPPEWKHAEVTMVPKPNKPLTIQNPYFVCGKTL